LNDRTLLVLAQAEMIEQDIARWIMQHLIHRLPRQLLVERRVEQLLDPYRVEVLCRACPGIAQRPDALSVARWRGLLALHHDVAGDFSAFRRSVRARELRLPGAGGRRGGLGEPEIGRPPKTLVRFGRDLSLRRNQSQLTFRRLLHREHDAQRRTAPRRDRRGEHRESSLILALGRRIFGCRL
jgi:hypothetical protein